MQGKFKLLLAITIFVFASLYFASKSEAFNTFTSAQDESRINNESTNVLRQIRDSNMQIIEQLKLINENLEKRGMANTGIPQTQNDIIGRIPAAPPASANPPLIRANP